MNEVKEESKKICWHRITGGLLVGRIVTTDFSTTTYKTTTCFECGESWESPGETIFHQPLSIYF